MKQLGTAEILNALYQPGLQLIDVRSADAYNGWRMRGEPRGGHLPGARSLPFKWTRYLDWPDLVRAKGVFPGRPLLLYGYSERHTRKVAERFERLGHDDVAIYGDFASSWCADPKFPLQRLPRYQQLVPPSWLHRLLVRGAIGRANGNRSYALCHTYYRDRGAYEEGHIPGAVALDTELLESPEGWNRRSPEEIEKALCRLGIAHDTTVVLYGRCANAGEDDPFPGSSAGHIAAMRCAFIMLHAGVRDVRILNGGLQAWCDEGHPTTSEEAYPLPISDFGAPVPGAPRFAVDLEEAKRLLASPAANLVCVRSPAEYRGEVSGYRYIHKAGRIPGAVFGNCGSDAYHMENYRNVDQTTREYHEIEAMWAEAGITREKRNAFYCGTGWRGSEAFINAWLMGWPRVSVFDGGWLEWSADPDNPIESGDPHVERHELAAGAERRE